MIKKNLKTLTEFKNPQHFPPSNHMGSRWRIHLEDGTFIDVNGEDERNRIITNLIRNGSLVGDVRVQPLNGAQTITLNFNVVGTEPETPTEVISKKNRLWNLMKSDFGGWDWSAFFLKTGLSFLFALLSILTQYITSGPIKLDNNEVVPFTTALTYMTGITLTMSALAWGIWKTWVFLPYITCWVKIVVFMLIFVLCELTVGSIDNSKSDLIMNFIGKYGISKRELKILKTTFNENDIL